MNTNIHRLHVAQVIHATREGDAEPNVKRHEYNVCLRGRLVKEIIMLQKSHDKRGFYLKWLADNVKRRNMSSFVDKRCFDIKSHRYV